MGSYAYKYVSDLLPPHLTSDKPDYEGEANYDGDQWYAAAEYIAELEAELRKQIAGSKVVFDRRLVEWVKSRPKTYYAEPVDIELPPEAPSGLAEPPPAAPSAPASQWIACSEHMPDDDIQVLVWATGNCWVAARAGDWFVDDDGRTVSNVTHWMDLPGEPKC
jgi:hypothetical protein